MALNPPLPLNAPPAAGRKVTASVLPLARKVAVAVAFDMSSGLWPRYAQRALAIHPRRGAPVDGGRFRRKPSGPAATRQVVWVTQSSSDKRRMNSPADKLLHEAQLQPGQSEAGPWEATS